MWGDWTTIWCCIKDIYLLFCRGNSLASTHRKELRVKTSKMIERRETGSERREVQWKQTEGLWKRGEGENWVRWQETRVTYILTFLLPPPLSSSRLCSCVSWVMGWPVVSETALCPDGLKGVPPPPGEKLNLSGVLLPAEEPVWTDGVWYLTECRSRSLILHMKHISYLNLSKKLNWQTDICQFKRHRDDIRLVIST